MTTASTSDPQKSDDLTTIRGIGAIREKLLRESLAIHSFQALAALSADEIESQLRSEGQFVSRGEIEQWIVQARQLANASATEQPNSPTAGPEWETAATFVVEFQERTVGEKCRTRVHHMEEDLDAEWPDVESIQLCRWMLEQLGEPTPELPEQVRAERWQDLEQELEEMRIEARQEWQKKLETEHSRRRKRMEQELEEQKAEARHALQQELTEIRRTAEQELAQKLEVEQARLQRELEQELEKRRVEAQQELAQELQQLRAEAREALAPEPKEPVVAEEGEEDAAPPPESKAPAEVKSAPRPIAVEQPPKLEIEAFYIYQPPQTGVPRVLGGKPTSPDVLRRDTPFSLVASFSVDVTNANELARKGVTYTVQFHVREISTGEVLQMGTTRPEKYTSGKSTYEARLPDVTLSAGLYRLAAFVITETMPPGGVYREASMLLLA